MDEFTPGLSTSHDAKVAICYLLDKLDRTVTERQLYEIVLNSEVINYFFYTEALSELIKNGSVSEKSINGENCIILEEKGRMGAEYFNEYIPYHFRKRLLEAALRFFAKLRRESETDINIRETDNGCEVHCTIKDTSFDLMRIALYAPDKDRAELIRQKILLDPAGFYSKVINYALDNTEEQPKAEV